jgi:hypothetical protein
VEEAADPAARGGSTGGEAAAVITMHPEAAGARSSVEPPPAAAKGIIKPRAKVVAVYDARILVNPHVSYTDTPSILTGY